MEHFSVFSFYVLKIYICIFFFFLLSYFSFKIILYIRLVFIFGKRVKPIFFVRLVRKKGSPKNRCLLIVPKTSLEIHSKMFECTN